MDLLQRFVEARLCLTARVPFLGYLLLHVRPRLAEPEDGVQVAAIARDGTLILNASACGAFSDAELRFVLGHEVLHVALDWWGRLKHRDPLLFNIAHDHAINLVLLDLAAASAGALKMPSHGHANPRFAQDSAEEIYARLEETRRADIAWAADLRQRYPKAAIDTPGTRALSIPLPGRDCRDDLAATGLGRQAAQGDASAARQLFREWQVHVEAARQLHEAGLGQGSLPAGLRLLLDALRAPTVSWREALSRWIGENALHEDWSYRRPSRRSESAGELLPGIFRSGLPDLTILWDTSGSMFGAEALVLAEVLAIVEELGLNVRLLVCDAAIQADVEGVQHIGAILPHLRGGGGSDFRPAFERLDAEADTSVVVAFTDGAIAVPTVHPPHLRGVLWVLTPRGRRPAAWGSHLNLPNDLAEEP